MLLHSTVKYLKQEREKFLLDVLFVFVIISTRITLNNNYSSERFSNVRTLLKILYKILISVRRNYCFTYICIKNHWSMSSCIKSAWLRLSLVVHRNHKPAGFMRNHRDIISGNASREDNMTIISYFTKYKKAIDVLIEILYIYLNA